MAKNIKFEVRVTVSGSNGVALYVPSHIVKMLDLKTKMNEKIVCVLDEDGDIIAYTSQTNG
jgi:hypothetical protein